MMMIARNTHALMGGGERNYGKVLGEEEGNDDYGGMVQPSQQHVAPCLKEVE